MLLLRLLLMLLLLLLLLRRRRLRRRRRLLLVVSMRRWPRQRRAGQTGGAGRVLHKRAVRVPAVVAGQWLPPPRKKARSLGCAYLPHDRHERPVCTLTRGWQVNATCDCFAIE